MLTFSIRVDVPDDVRPDLDEAGMLGVVIFEASRALVECGLTTHPPSVSHIRGTRKWRKGYQVVPRYVDSEDPTAEGEDIG